MLSAYFSPFSTHKKILLGTYWLLYFKTQLLLLLLSYEGTIKKQLLTISKKKKINPNSKEVKKKIITKKYNIF